MTERTEGIPMMRLSGTREEIVGLLMEQYAAAPEQLPAAEQLPVVRQYFECLLDTIVDEYEVRSDIENVYTPRQAGGPVQGFVMPEQQYYISIKQSTFLLLSVLAKLILSEKVGAVPAGVAAAYIHAQFPSENLALLRRLDGAGGEICILLEAAREKRGIDQNLLRRFKGECANNHLPCRYRYNGDRCSCDRTRVAEICENLVKDRVLRKDVRRYYYTDIV